MIDPVYFDFEASLDRVALFLSAEADLLADNLQVRIQKMLASGMAPDAVKAALKRDLATGGPIFSGFSSTFRRTAAPMIDNAAQESITAANAQADRWEWITTSVEPCDDCEPRHGDIKSYDAWAEAGLPRSGFSVCGENCKCVLVPAGNAGATIKAGPVKVPSLAESRAAFQEQLKTDTALQAKIAEYKAARNAARRAASNT